MRLLLDSDGLIKLHRAGVVSHVIRAFDCIIPQTVYDEVVTQGRARLHQDAEALETALSGTVAVVPVHIRRSESGLGAGELGILSLLAETPDAIVVSDDRRFLTVLATQGTPFLTPADMVVVLARRDLLTGDEARQALDRLRPVIRLAAYWDARQDLASGGEDHEED